jgi:hypothetical protein
MKLMFLIKWETKNYLTIEIKEKPQIKKKELMYLNKLLFHGLI